MTGPLPRALLTSGRDLTEPRLAPIGPPRVAFLQRVGSTTSINAVDVGDRADRAERILTFGPQPAPGRGLGGGCFSWVARGDELSIVYVARSGELWWQRGVDLVRLDGPDPDSSVLGEGGRTCRAPAVDASGRRVIYAVDEASVWSVDLDAVASGEPAVPERLDDGRHAFCFDPCISGDGLAISWQAWSPPDMPWDGSSRIDVQLDAASGAATMTEQRLDDAAIQQPRHTVLGDPVQVDDRSGWLNVSGPDGPLVAEPVEHAGPTWGMGNRSYAFGPGGRRVAVTRNEQGFGSLVVHDLMSGTSRRLGRGVHGHVDWVGDTIVAVRTGARTPTQVVAYHADSGARTVVAESGADAWPTDQLPEPEVIDILGSDGVRRFARRYVAGTGRLLAWVHGGPTDQWRVDWRPRIHYWWSRGWDVLVVDPRGTTGHGRRHQQALHGAWGRRDVDDTAALVAHAHDEGWATPASTVVIGGSSGGLTVLGLLADHPGLVVGGVASYPVSDLRALADATHRFEAHYTDTLVAPADGSPAADAVFETLSPINRVEHITGSLLIFHGTDDPVVPIDQSRRLVERMRSVGSALDHVEHDVDRDVEHDVDQDVEHDVDQDVELVEYVGEGHGFRDPDHVADEYRRTEAFLDRLVPAPSMPA